MTAVRHLGFVKFDYLMAGAVKGHILHQRTKFYKDRSKNRKFSSPWQQGSD